ncbi:MAG: hypothetical protein PF541_07805 [Prolixibacteraceae bacterium]|jgi:tetratricopeptide (TPR) repeat protein|nr:hypothetical protein [Prolixibacteraceae bacterium]
MNKIIITCAFVLCLFSCKKDRKNYISQNKHNIIQLMNKLDDFEKNDTTIIIRIDSIFNELLKYENTTEIQNLRANFYMQTSNLKLSEQCYLKSLEINDNDINANMMLGILNDVRNNSKTAQKYYIEAVRNLDTKLKDKEINLETFMLWQNKAYLIMLSQNKESAITFLRNIKSNDSLINKSILFEIDIIENVGKEGFIKQLLNH